MAILELEKDGIPEEKFVFIQYTHIPIFIQVW